MKEIYRRAGLLLYPSLLPIMRPLLNRSERVYVAVIYDGKVLLIKNWLARDVWRLPGGGKGRSEASDLAACREVKEELGIDIKPTALIELLTTQVAHDGLRYKYRVYAYRLNSLPSIDVQKFEITAYGWFEFAEDQFDSEMTRIFKILKSRGLV